MSFLKKFFAVTISGSLYKVEFNEAEDIGIVEKVALQKGSQSGLPVGTKLGIGTNDFAGRGDFIGLANYGLVIYYGYGKKRPLMEFINNHYWGGKTSAIVALFLKKTEAQKCLKASDLRKQDMRWSFQTAETLAAISHEHPKFTLSVMDPVAKSQLVK